MVKSCIIRKFTYFEFLKASSSNFRPLCIHLFLVLRLGGFNLNTRSVHELCNAE